MYLFGESYFQTVAIRNLFNFSFIFFIISEMLIWAFTYFNGEKQSGKSKKGDKDSYLMLVAGFVSIVVLNPLCRKKLNIMLPEVFAWIGSFMILAGVIIRTTSVWTLRKFFTLSVKVNSDQKIIDTGMYKYIRHPAYTGSILSLLGTSLSFTNLIGLILTIVILGSIYSYRIKVEEKIMEKSFGECYVKYEKNTWRIVPFIW